MENLKQSNINGEIKYLKKIRDYWNLRSMGYSQKNKEELCSETANVWAQRLKKFLPEKRELECIDIGCGPGFLGILLAKMGHNVYLADYSDGMLEKAEENAKNEGVIVNTKKVDAQNPDFSDESFDVVVSRNLVWNLENPERAYTEWLRILKPGGRLIVFDGNHYLYRFDENYMEERKCPNFKDPHTKEYIQGVDSSIMENIAINLPLSKVERPKWDMEFFLKKQVKSIYTEPVWNEFTGIDGKRKTVIRAFTVCVEK